MRDTWKKIKPYISSKKVIIIIYLFFSLAAGTQAILKGTKIHKDRVYTHYNNYKIFQYSHFHLVEDQDLYNWNRDHLDLFKYTPTFAALFGLFAYLPDKVGLYLWNILNALVLLLAVYYLPKLNNYQKGLILLICVIELMTNMQNEQSNALVAGLLILGFGLLENKKYFLALMCIVFTAFIKLFGVVGMALLIFYPKKWKLALYTVAVTLIFLAIPLIFIDLEQYEFLFNSYGNLLASDHATFYGMSFLGIVQSWFQVEFDKILFVLGGVVVFLIPLIRFELYKNYRFRLLALCSILIWVVIFNYKAESPTFIIAVSGVAIWFVSSERNKINVALFVLAYSFTVLAPTDVYPPVVRIDFFEPYAIKAFPCVLVWFKIIWDMVTMKITNLSVAEEQQTGSKSVSLSG